MSERLKVLIGYTAHARWLREATAAGWTPNLDYPKEPYRSGPTKAVYAWRDRYVVVLETAHRRYEVHRCGGQIYPTDRAAENAWANERAFRRELTEKGVRP